MKKKIAAAVLLAAAVPAGAETLGEALTDSSRVIDWDDVEVVAQPSRVIDLDDVVVVAQPKDVARLRDLPLASSVFTSAEMERVGAKGLSRLADFTPSLAVPAYGARYTSSIYVRGIGSRIGEAAVGVYYDNIPLIGKASLNRHFYQLDRVDVLRGPQATLYGVNSEGGLLRLSSKNPMAYQGTELRLGMGTGLTANAEVAHYHRPSEKFAFSFAAFYDGQQGFFDNAHLGKKADLANEAGARMRFVLTPTRRTTLDLTADYQYTNQDGFAYGQYFPAENLTADPSTNLANGYKRQLASAALNVSHASDRLLFTSTTSYQFLRDLMQMDQDYTSADLLRLSQRQRLSALTQELTLRSRGDGWWRHSSGLFFSHEWLRTEAPVFFGDDMNSRILGAMLSSPAIPDAVKGGLSIADNWVPGTFRTPFTNFGVYHESHFRLAPRLTATLGLRYDHEHVSISYDTQSQFTMQYNINMYGRTMQGESRFASVMRDYASEEYHQLLPKAALTYGLGKAGNVYATVAKGFRAGGYNLQMFSDIFQAELQGMGSQLMAMMRGDLTVTHTEADYANVEQTISYKPETSWNYEVGAHLNLFGGALHADLAAYLTRVSDQQLSVMASDYGYGRMMVNAGRSRSLGAELSLRGSAFDGQLQWTAAYGYTHATFRDYTDNGTDYRGKRVPFIPEHTMGLTADYRLPFASSLLHTVTIGANVSGNGKTYWDSDNALAQNFYATLGAHAAFDFGAVCVDLWGRNLTDTRYHTFLVSSSATGQPLQFAQRGLPVRVGVDVTVKF